MSKTYQTVIYHKPTGSILRVAPNQYISSKRHLARLVHRPHWKDIGFLYFPYDIDIDLGKHHVSKGAFPGPAYVTDKVGTNIAVLAVYAAAKILLLKSKSLLYIFEGGLGDYINEGNVISYILSKHPDKKIYISAKSERYNLLSCFPNVEKTKLITGAKGKNIGLACIEFSRISQLDSNYPPFGKRGVYASLAGIDPTFPQANLDLPKESLSWAAKKWSSVSNKKTTLRISLHTRSGEPNSKTWPWKYTPALIDLLRSKYSSSFAIFGGHGQESLEAPDIINGVGHFDWVKVASLIKKSHLTICIDSAIMHISHHLNIPTLSLWGPTAAGYILPQNHGTPVIESKVECHPCGNYLCKKGDCMLSITPDHVVKKVSSIIDSLHGT